MCLNNHVRPMILFLFLGKLKFLQISSWNIFNDQRVYDGNEEISRMKVEPNRMETKRLMCVFWLNRLDELNWSKNCEISTHAEANTAAKRKATVKCVAVGNKIAWQHIYIFFDDGIKWKPKVVRARFDCLLRASAHISLLIIGGTTLVFTLTVCLCLYLCVPLCLNVSCRLVRRVCCEQNTSASSTSVSPLDQKSDTMYVHEYTPFVFFFKYHPFVVLSKLPQISVSLICWVVGAQCFINTVFFMGLIRFGSVFGLLRNSHSFTLACSRFDCFDRLPPPKPHLYMFALLCFVSFVCWWNSEFFGV